MTREEIIESLEEYLPWADEYEVNIEVLRGALDLLKQELTPGQSEEAKDLIDRAECLKRIEEKTMEPSIQANEDTANGLGGAWQIVYSMPKAKLEIPTARWTIGNNESGRIIACGNCGRVFPTMEPYCGNCGCRMLKPVKEEEA